MEDQPEEFPKQLNNELSTPILNMFRKRSSSFLQALLKNRWGTDD